MKARELVKRIDEMKETLDAFSVNPGDIMVLKGILNIAVNDKRHAFNREAKAMLDRLNKHIG